MFLIKKIGNWFLFLVWLVVCGMGIIVRLMINIVAIVKGFIVLGLIGLTLGTIICYKDFIQVMFLITLIVSAILILCGIVFVDVMVQLLKEKIETIMLG